MGKEPPEGVGWPRLRGCLSLGRDVLQEGGPFSHGRAGVVDASTTLLFPIESVTVFSFN